jgi:cyclic-di-GMP-binding protein
MAQDNSFDIVSKVDIQEVRNAIDQAIKEIRQRFDLKDSHSEVNLEGQESIELASANEYKLEAVKDILAQKLVKRGVSLKNISYGKLEQAAGQSVRQKISLQQGIPVEKAKEIVRLVKDSRAILCASPARAVTICRRSWRCCAPRRWASICSSPTIERFRTNARWVDLIRPALEMPVET